MFLSALTAINQPPQNVPRDTLERVQEQKRTWANHHVVRNVFMAFETTTDATSSSCAILTSNCGVNEDAARDCMERRFALGLSSSARRYRKLVHAITLGVRGAQEKESAAEEWANHYSDVLPDYLVLTYDSNTRGYNISRLAECEGLHGHRHVPVVYEPDDQGIIFSMEALERLLRLVPCLPHPYKHQTGDPFEDQLCDFVARLTRDETNPYSIHGSLLMQAIDITQSNSQSLRQVSVIDMLSQYASTLHILCENNTNSQIPSSKEMLEYLLRELQLGVPPHETCL